MPLAKKHSNSRQVFRQDRSTPHVPMGDQRFQQLMSELGAAFAQSDDGEDKRRQAMEREREHERWMARRETAIREIVAAMRQHGLSVEDLI